MGEGIQDSDTGTDQSTVSPYKFTYRASGLGSCIKSLIAARIGYEGLDVYSGMQIMAEGNLHEGDVVNRLREQGWVISRQQEECEKILPGFGVNITGHNDGIIQWKKDDTHTDSPLVLEIKSMGDSSFKDWKRRGWSNPGLLQKYKWQCSFYMNAYSMPLMFVVKNRNSGEIDTDFVRVPFYSWADIVARITTIELAARNSELPERCEWQMYPCPFNYLHEEEQETQIGDDELSELVAEYIRKRDARDKLVAECKVILGEIKEKAGDKKIDFGFAKYTLSNTRRVTYDFDKMRENGIDPDEYEVVTFTGVPKVTKSKVKEEEKDDSSTGSVQE